MRTLENLFLSNLEVINVGLDSFGENIKNQNISVVQVNWKPHIYSTSQAMEFCNIIKNSPLSEKIASANKTVVEKMLNAQPAIHSIGKALDVIPGMKDNLFLHAGPPITWERMPGPLKGAMIGGLLYEKRASTPEEAIKILQSGQIKFAPCHHHSSVGPMAGVITPSMPVWIIKNEFAGNYAYATLNEGLGKVLRYGAYSNEVIQRLQWMEKTLAPILKQVLERHGPIDLKTMITQALQMGDEGHNRNKAGTSLFIREIAPYIVMLDAPKEEKAEVLKFINSNDHFFLNLTMPASKCVMDSIMGTEYSTIVGIMARNGTDFGIKLTCLPDQWFTGPAQQVEGLFFPQYSSEDANPDIGDSVITETAGIGGFAMASAPAIVQFIGGTASDALACTNDMYEITTDEHSAYKIPVLNFRGTPTGIDLLKVIESGILPAINTGIAHKEPGIGMVGAGLVRPPANCFEDALIAYYERYKSHL